MKRNWKIYNESLVRRYEFYISKKVYNKWKEELTLKNKGKVGRAFKYTDCFIQWLFMLKCLFKVGYRDLEGIARSIGKSLGIDGFAPDYSTIQKRFKKLDISLQERFIRMDKREKNNGGIVIIALDSTGLTPCFKGHYRRKPGKKMGYIKLHVSVDVNTNEVLAVKVTDEKVTDSKEAISLIEESMKVKPGIKAVIGDGGYDDKDIYKFCYGEEEDKGSKKLYFITKPRKDAKQRVGRYYRNVLIDKKNHPIYKLIYGKRWMAETFFSRYKCIFGDDVFSRNEDMIKREIIFKASLLNEFIYQENELKVSANG